MYSSSYTSYAYPLRAKSSLYSYSLLPSSSPSDHEFIQNLNPNPRLLLFNGYFSRQSALLYWSPSRTLLTAAVASLVAGRRTPARYPACLPPCKASCSSRSCVVSVREIRCCHCHCSCDWHPSRERRGRKLLERRVREVWNCDEDYECESDESDFTETRDRRRRERGEKSRVSDHERRAKHFDYGDDKEIRALDRKRRYDYDYDEDGYVKRRDEKFRVSDRRRRDECDYERDNFRGRNDRSRVSDRMKREEYSYDEEDTVRRNDDRIRVSDYRRREDHNDYDYEDFRRRDDQIRVSDRRRQEKYSDYEDFRQKDDNIGVSDRQRREKYSDYDYDYDYEDFRRKDDRIRVLDDRGRKECKDEKTRVSDLMRREEYKDEKTRVYGDFKEDDRIRVSDRRRREGFYNHEDEKIRVLDRKEEKIGKFTSYTDSDREERENYNRRKESKEGSQQIKIIAEDDSNLVSNYKSRQGIASTSSSVQNVSRVTGDKRNTVNQLTVNEMELDLQNRNRIESERKRVDTGSSVQNVTQVRRDQKNIVNQHMVNETELDLQNRTRIESERKRVDSTSSVQNVTQVTRDKKNIVNQFTVSETELDLQNRNRVESERKRVDATSSVQNMSQVTRDKKNIVNQLTVNETELDLQNRNRVESERRRVDASTSVQNVTQITRDKKNVVNQVTVSETESDVLNQVHVIRDKKNIINQFTVSETESDVQNRTHVDLTRASSSTTDQTIDNSRKTGSIESASLLEKSSSSYIGEYVDSVHKQIVDQSVSGVKEKQVREVVTERKGPSDELWDQSVAETTVNETKESENTVTRKQNKSLWGFVADIIKLGFLPKNSGDSLSTSSLSKKKNGKRSSSSDSRGTDEWFSGQEEVPEEEGLLPKNNLFGGKIDNSLASPSQEERIVLEELPQVVASTSIEDQIEQKSTSCGGQIEKRTSFGGEIEQKSTFGGQIGQKSASFGGQIKQENSSTYTGGVTVSQVTKGERELKRREKGASTSSVCATMELPVSGVAGEITTPIGTTVGVNVSGVMGGERVEREEENLRGRRLRRVSQVPSGTFNEWEEGYVREREDKGTSSSSAIVGMQASGVTGVEVVERERRLKRVSQVPSGTFNEWEEGNVREREDKSTSSSSAIVGIHASGVTGVAPPMREKAVTDEPTKKIVFPSSSTTTSLKTGMHASGVTTSSSSSMGAVVEMQMQSSGVTGSHPPPELVRESVEREEGTVSLKGRRLKRVSQASKETFDEWEEAYSREREQRRLDEFFMREALVEAQRAADSWEVPVGAVLVRNGEIITRGCNLVEELRDSTAHAEMICIRQASNLLHSWRLAETTLYVTLEPCAMCAGAILQARVDSVVWGAPNKLLGADGSWVRLFPGDVGSSTSLDPPTQQAGPVHPFHPKITIRRGILETECSEIMQQFFQLRRKRKVNNKNNNDNNNNKQEPAPSCLPVPAHPVKFFARMHDMFSGMFCM